MGRPRKTLSNRVIVARAQGKIPDGSHPDGFAVKGVSTLYNKDGEIAATWVKTEVDRRAPGADHPRDHRGSRRRHQARQKNNPTQDI